MDRVRGEPVRRLEKSGTSTRIEAGDLEQAIRCQVVICYVTNNRCGITSYRIVPQASSGPIEKGVDITGCRHLKTRDMSWFRQGVSHLRHRKLLRLNGPGTATRPVPWPHAAIRGRPLPDPQHRRSDASIERAISPE